MAAGAKSTYGLMTAGSFTGTRTTGATPVPRTARMCAITSRVVW